MTIVLLLLAVGTAFIPMSRSAHETITVAIFALAGIYAAFLLMLCISPFAIAVCVNAKGNWRLPPSIGIAVLIILARWIASYFVNVSDDD
jgi:hypothetical protein